MSPSTRESLLKMLFPMRKPLHLRGLSERAAFDVRYREVFGAEATDAEYEDYTYSPGECRIAFMNDFSVGSFLLSTLIWAPIVVGALAGLLAIVYHLV